LARMQQVQNARCRISTLAAIVGRGRKGILEVLLRTPLCWWSSATPHVGGLLITVQFQSLASTRWLDLTDFQNAISTELIPAWAMPRTVFDVPAH